MAPLFYMYAESPQRSFHIIEIKEPSPKGQESLQEDLAKAHAGDQLTRADSQHEQRNAAGDVIGVGQDKRDDQRI